MHTEAAQRFVSMMMSKNHPMRVGGSFHNPYRQGAESHETEEEENEEQGPRPVLDARGIVDLVHVEEPHGEGSHEVEYETQDDEERMTPDFSEKP